ncbi:ASCH domain-containing protein [Streptomyces sp. NBC_01278]|uniref:ASCH domain-containing protein n=1 Tax=Streptomyces sp. NBC_01278 TaxID=2903809 RepID=UPI002E301FC4|nr:ASCH domain-containing protein [Streptomyces sp. NBC_01278]
MTTYDDLPPALFAFPGPVRDMLVAAVLSGAKTSTTGLLTEYEVMGDPLPVVGERMAVMDSAQRPVAVLEVTGVRALPLAEEDLGHAPDEGEGYASVAEWRVSHERYWHGPQIREVLGDPEFTVTDDTLVVAERFRVVEPP